MLASKERLKQLFKEYNYMILMGLSSLLVLGKSYLYSFLLNAIDFADFNLYLLAIGIIALLSPLGFLLKCHSELPRLLKSGEEEKVTNLLGLTKTTALLSCAIFFIASLLLSDSLGLQLGVIQGFLYALFFTDQIVIKSRLMMSEYVRRILLRNLLVGLAGLLGYWFYRSIDAVYFFEIIISLFLSGLLGNLKITIQWNAFIEAAKNRGYFLADSAGTAIAMIERVIAGYFFDAKLFSLFSYFYVLVITAATLQQFINTRFLTESALSVNLKQSLQAAIKRSGVSLLICCGGLMIVLLVLSWNASYFEQTSALMLAGFVVLAVLKGIDFFTTLLIVFQLKRYLILGQFVYLLTLVIISAIMHVHNNLTIMNFLNLAIILNCLYYGYLYWMLKQFSRRKSILD